MVKQVSEREEDPWEVADARRVTLPPVPADDARVGPPPLPADAGAPPPLPADDEDAPETSSALAPPTGVVDDVPAPPAEALAMLPPLPTDDGGEAFPVPGDAEPPAPPSLEALDDVPAPPSLEALDDVPAPPSLEALDDVPAPPGAEALDDVPAPPGAEALDDVPAPPDAASLELGDFSSTPPEDAVVGLPPRGALAAEAMHPRIGEEPSMPPLDATVNARGPTDDSAATVEAPTAPTQSTPPTISIAASPEPPAPPPLESLDLPPEPTPSTPPVEVASTPPAVAPTETPVEGDDFELDLDDNELNPAPAVTAVAVAAPTAASPAARATGWIEWKEAAAPVVSSDVHAAATAKSIALLTGRSNASGKMIVAAAMLALTFHVSIGYGTAKLAKPVKLEERVEMAIYEPPPPPPPPPEPEPEPEKKPEPEKPKIKKQKVAKAPEPPPEPPPSNEEPPPDEPPPAEPPPIVTGISMSSTAKGKSGFKVRVGNTAYGDPNSEKFVDPSKIKAYRGGKAGGKAKEFKAARAADVTTQAEPLRRFKPRYPKQLLDEGIEGTVVLLVEVTKDGQTNRIKILKRLHPKLDVLSVQAVKKFQWRPATINGKKVDSRVRYQFRWEVTS
jgi:TonB family protein